MATDKRKKRSLVQEGEPSQKTEGGSNIPLPRRDEFFRNLSKVSKADESETKRRPKQ